MVLLPLLDVALDRGIRARIPEFSDKPVADALRGVALFSRHALVFLKPAINHSAQRLAEHDRAGLSGCHRWGGAEIVLVDVLVHRGA